MIFFCLFISDCSSNSTNLVNGRGLSATRSQAVLIGDGNNTLSECSDSCKNLSLTNNSQINAAILIENNGSCLCQQNVIIVDSMTVYTTSYSTCIFKEAEDRGSYYESKWYLIGGKNVGGLISRIFYSSGENFVT